MSPRKRRPRRNLPRVRSVEACPYCGLRYERFRHPTVPSFREAYEIQLERSRALVAEHQDYSKPADLCAVLGLMHQLKASAWRDEHLAWCRPEDVEPPSWYTSLPTDHREAC